MADTKTRTPIVFWLAVVAMVGVGGAMLGVDWGSFLDKGTDIIGERERNPADSKDEHGRQRLLWLWL